MNYLFINVIYINQYVFNNTLFSNLFLLSIFNAVGGRYMQRLLMIFKALSEETRLRILKLLENGELCVCDITDVLNMSQPNISFHLGMLKEAGLIKDKREGRWMYYSLNGSDVFIRFLLFGILERFRDNVAEEDKKRLISLLSTKKNNKITPITEIEERKIC